MDEVVRNTDAMLLCVGTPTADDESPDLRFVASAPALIAAVLRDGRPYTLLMRSTVPPGTIEQIVIPALERASRRLVGAADGLRVLAVPEFLREACAIADFDDPPFIIVGTQDGPSKADQSLIRDL